MFDIEKFIKEKKITQKELANVLGVSQPFISQIKDGKRELPSNKKKLLKKKFGDISAYIVKQSAYAKPKKVDLAETVASQQKTIENLSEIIIGLRNDLDTERSKNSTNKKK